MKEGSQVKADWRQRRGAILASMSAGHGIVHLYDFGLPAIMPTIASAMGLSTLQVATMHGIRQAGFGLVNLLGGPVVDMLKHQWGLILTWCMAWAAVSFAVIGASPNYAVLLVGIVFVSIPGALWHLPSTAALSRRFPDRRGFAISMHGFGSNIGNAVGPILAGALLGILVWRAAVLIYALPALLVAAFVWWTLKEVGREGGEAEQLGMGAQLGSAMALMKSPVVLMLILASTFRNMGLEALFHWTPFYLEEELGMGHFMAGFHLSLLTGMGIVSGPVLGALSDKVGRKAVLVPGLTIATVLSLLVVTAGGGYLLALVLAAMGLFSFALHHIMQAALLDLVDRGTEATATGLLFGLNSIVGISSSFLAAVVIAHFGGFGSIFYYSGILTALTAVLVVFIPLSPVRQPAPSLGGTENPS